MQAIARKIISKTNSESIKNAIAAKMPAAAYESWIAPLKISADENILNIVAQNQFSADFIRRTYINVLESVADEFGLTLSIGVGRPVQNININANDNNLQNFKSAISNQQSAIGDFDSFISCDENAFAISAAKKLASGAASFSPLFIYGVSGCGKTLLANCINSAARGRTLMMTGAQFVSEFLRAINEKSVFAFKDFCRNCDTFILDDVQTLAGKRACTDEFLALVLDLGRAGVNMVLTANAAPGNLSGFDRRVQSVFASGLTADLTVPTKSVRCAMLSRAGISADVADALAARVAADGHLVAGVIKKMGAYAELMDEKITTEIAERLLADTLQKNKTPLGMVRAMCEKMGVSYDAVASSARQRSIVRARQIMMFALKSATRLSLNEIGRLIGDRDHATVLYGINQIDAARKTDLILTAEIEQMINECR
jgi:chromosomal replication initiator protein